MNRGKGKPRLDPVIQFRSIYAKDWSFSIALRNSGNVDFYWNYLRIKNDEDEDGLNKNKRITQIEATFEAFYLKRVLNADIQIKKVLLN